MKNTGIFFLGNVLSKVIIFLLLPLYTNYISTESYGYYDLSVSYITVLTSLVFFDIWSTVLRFMYDSEDERGKQKVASTCWLLFSLSSVLFLIIGGTVCSLYSVQYAPLILGYGLSVNLHNMCGFITRGWKKNVHFAISGILNTLTMVLANIVMILGFHIEIESLYISAILGNLVQVLYLSVAARAYPRFKNFSFDKTLLSSIVKYTVPLCINSVSYWLLTSYNRVVLEDVLGLSANGIYAIGNKFGATISLATTCFTYAWQDLAFSRQTKNPNDGRFFAKACDAYFLFLSAGIALLLPCFHILFPFLIGEAYQEAFSTIPPFLVMAVLSAYSTFVGNVFYAIKDTKIIFISMLLSCICNLVLCQPMIQNWGINGANFSICISFIVNIVIRSLILYKRISFKPGLMYVLLGGGMILLSTIIYLYADIVGNCLYFFAIVVAVGIVLLFKYRDGKVNKSQ